MSINDIRRWLRGEPTNGAKEEVRKAAKSAVDSAEELKQTIQKYAEADDPLQELINGIRANKARPPVVRQRRVH